MSHGEVKKDDTLRMKEAASIYLTTPITQQQSIIAGLNRSQIDHWTFQDRRIHYIPSGGEKSSLACP